MFDKWRWPSRGRKRIRRRTTFRRGNHVFESLESRLPLTASGFEGNPSAPDLDFSNLSAQTIAAGESLTLNLLDSGGLASDADGTAVRLLLDPDIGTDTPSGATLTEDGFFEWTPTTEQVGTHTIIVIAVDQGSPPLADAEEFTISVTDGTNLVPSVDLNGSDDVGDGFSAQFQEDAGPTSIVDGDLSVEDGNDTTLASASVTINNALDGADELLSVDTTGTSITSDYDSSTATLTLTGTHPLTSYEQVLRTLTYDNTSQDPNTPPRNIEITVNDGLANSPPVTSVVSVESINDAPELDLTASTGDFTEDGGPLVILDSGSTINDVDSVELVSATITLSNALDGSDELLSVDTTGTSLTSTYDSDTGVLQMTGNDSPAAYQLAFRSVTYNNSSQDPNTTSRVIEFVVNDGEDTSAPATATISVVAKNDAPELDPIPNQTAVLDQQLEVFFTVTDRESNDTLTFQLDEDEPNFPTSAELVPLDNDSAVMRWTPTSDDGAGPFVIRVIVTDDGTPSLSDTEQFEVTVVTDAPNAPAVDLNGTDEAGIDFTTTFTENGGAVAIVDSDLRISDPDDTSLESATVRLTNPLDGDAEQLIVDTGEHLIVASYDAGSGTLQLSGTDLLGNYEQVFQTLMYQNSSENPDTTRRRIEVVVNDGSVSSPTATATVNVEAVNDAPFIAQIPKQKTDLNQQIEIPLVGTDVDSDALIFVLKTAPSTAELEQTGPTDAIVRWTPTGNTGLFDFEVTASDNDSPVREFAIMFQVMVEEVPVIDHPLRISEINYNPAEPTEGELAVDPSFDKDDFEFMELTNVSAAAIELEGIQFIQGIDFTFGAQTLDPGEHVVVVSYRIAFELRYGDDILIAVGNGQDGGPGEYGGRLSNSGERITLLDATGDQSFVYDDAGDWPERADGNASSLEVLDTSGDYDDPNNWRSSSEFGGSPGRAGAGPDNRIVFNEVLAHTDPPDVDMIELYNTTNSSIDISDWFLSDESSNNYFKYKIPAGTTVDPQGYHVFTETQFNFALDSAHGENLTLVEADSSGKPLRFVDRVQFAGTENGVSLGRWPQGTGRLFPMKELTIGATNTGPAVGDLTITEIHYYPADPDDADDLEFIELINATGSAIDPTIWEISGATDYSFPALTAVIEPGEAIVVVGFNPANAAMATQFRNTYGISNAVRLFGPYDQPLDDMTTRIRIKWLDEPPTTEPDFFPEILADEVRYFDAAPWPTEAAGGGSSLNRISVGSFGEFSESWTAAAPTPGTYEN